MAPSLKNSPYFVDRYIRCGEMPLFIIFCHNRRGIKRHCIMLCSFSSLRKLLRMRHGFMDPAKFGRVLYKGRGDEITDMMKGILKERFDFNVEAYNPN